MLQMVGGDPNDCLIVINNANGKAEFADKKQN